MKNLCALTNIFTFFFFFQEKLLFYMGVKLGRSQKGTEVSLGCSRTSA
jgi:hypothetical protein